MLKKQDPLVRASFMYTISKKVPMTPEHKKRAEKYAKQDAKKATLKLANKLIKDFFNSI
jgi:hypothetical protein